MAEVTVAWTDNTGGTHWHRLYYRRTGDPDWLVGAETEPGVTQETVAGLDEGTEYEFVATAFDGTLESRFSDPPLVVTTTAPEGTLVGSSEGTSEDTGTVDAAASVVGSSEGTSEDTATVVIGAVQIVGSSEGTSEDTATFDIEAHQIIGTSEGNSDTTASVALTESIVGSSTGESETNSSAIFSEALTGSSEGTSEDTASFAIHADLVGSSEGTSEDSGSAVKPPTNAPVLTATGQEGSNLLEWTQVGNTKDYVIYRSTTDKATPDPADQWVTTTLLSFKDNNVNVGTVYYYWVTARNPDGEGPFSNRDSATPQEFEPIFDATFTFNPLLHRLTLPLQNVRPSIRVRKTEATTLDFSHTRSYVFGSVYEALAEINYEESPQELIETLRRGVRRIPIMYSFGNTEIDIYLIFEDSDIDIALNRQADMRPLKMYNIEVRLRKVDGTAFGEEFFEAALATT